MLELYQEGMGHHVFAQNLVRKCGDVMSPLSLQGFKKSLTTCGKIRSFPSIGCVGDRDEFENHRVLLNLS